MVPDNVTVPAAWGILFEFECNYSMEGDGGAQESICLVPSFICNFFQVRVRQYI